jgi:hypothetical protein
MPEKAVTISWKPTVTPAGVGSYKLQRQVGKRDWQDIAVPGSKARQARVWLKTGMPNRFRIRATDGKGRTGPWAYSDDRTAALRGPVGLRLGSTRLVAGRPDRGSQAGRAQADKGHAGKAHARRNHARRAHAGRALVSFTGRSVAFVSRTGPGMGKARIFVDGKRIATVDLERQATTSRKLVWARNLGSLKRHTIAVKAVGPDRPVHFQGFYVLR